MKRADLTIPLLVLFVVLASCGTKENIDEVESSAAMAASRENLVNSYARRVRRAEAKLDEYRDRAEGVEGSLKSKRGEIRDLRAEVTRRAQEIQGLKKEIGTLDQEIAGLKKRRDELATAKDSEAGLVAKAQAELEQIGEERRQWALRLADGAALHEELAEVINPILAMLPRFEGSPAAADEEPAPADEAQAPAPESRPSEQPAQ